MGRKWRGVTHSEMNLAFKSLNARQGWSNWGHEEKPEYAGAKKGKSSSPSEGAETKTHGPM